VVLVVRLIASGVADQSQLLGDRTVASREFH
jgi:hypothetical protein